MFSTIDGLGIEFSKVLNGTYGELLLESVVLAALGLNIPPLLTGPNPLLVSLFELTPTLRPLLLSTLFEFKLPPNPFINSLLL